MIWVSNSESPDSGDTMVRVAGLALALKKEANKSAATREKHKNDKASFFILPPTNKNGHLSTDVLAGADASNVPKQTT